MNKRWFNFIVEAWVLLLAHTLFSSCTLFILTLLQTSPSILYMFAPSASFWPHVEIYKWRPPGCPQTQTWDDPEVWPSKEWQCHHCWWGLIYFIYLTLTLIRNQHHHVNDTFNVFTSALKVRLFCRPDPDTYPLFEELWGGWALQWTCQSVRPWL